jgi:hypothetical protein
MKKNILFGLVILVALVAPRANATGVFSMGSQSGGPTRTYPQLPIYFDATLSQNQAKAKGAGLTAEQTLLSWQMGVTFAIGGPVFVGLTYDYRTISQFSQASVVDGDQSGKREFFAPTAGVRLYNFVFKVDYQTTGDYRLDRKSATGNDIAYVSPKGFRGTFLIDLYRGLGAGLVYESVTYSSGYESGAAPLGFSESLTVTQTGLALSYVY